ncbi:hypothetical protein [Rudaeicoccus suwonensis]|uniref:O-antigen ligase-like membrane protein n=1 Tax=Rudaeicoccus suwonensis TaxID=657409 RepID=A0A561E879_9MICO|nr:hypothetical protein [Rudaeicoccus suwonensis]TWE11819.1 hypothetical protein BKA23_0606 [Rudaeicoccus suwonensis]
MITAIPAFAPGKMLSADKVSMLILVAGLLAIVLGVLATRPKLGVLAWFAVICFIPCWIEVTVKVSFSAAMVMAILLVLVLLPARPSYISVADWIMGGLFIAGLAPIAVHASTKTAAFDVLTQWLTGYLVGRTIAVRVGIDWIYRCVAVFFGIVAVLGLMEFATSWNPFLMLKMNNAAYLEWSPQQIRGGMLRVDGAFGQSIAFGASLALAIPLVLAAKIPWRHRMTIVTLILATEVVTFSRTGMMSAALAIGFSLLGRNDMTARLRALVVTATSLIVVIAVPLLLNTYADAGTEATGSADYRLRLTELIPDISTLGLSSVAHVAPDGTLFFGQFRSIDSEVILMGLTYGLLAVAIALALLLVGIYLVFTRQAAPATIAVVAQIPNLLTVALITQYQIFFWFMVGLAVYSQAARLMSDPSRGRHDKGIRQLQPAHMTYARSDTGEDL